MVSTVTSERQKMEDNRVNDDYTEKIKSKIVELGGDLVGVADVEPLKQLKLNPPDLLNAFRRAISIAVRLPAAVFEQILDRPTPVYASVRPLHNPLERPS